MVTFSVNSKRCFIVLFLASSLISTLSGVAKASNGPTGSTVMTTGDLDDDGYDDMVVGVPAEDIRSDRNDSLRNEINAGITHVLYGREGGLSAERTQLLHRDLSVEGGRILGDLAHSDWFGSAVASGDFDGDGYDDVAVGSPFEDRENDPEYAVFEGSVNVIYGSPTGLTAAKQDLWHQGVKGIADRREELDFFGSQLAAGDFGGSSHDDLAIGVHGERLPTEDGKHGYVGAVHVLYGSDSGLTTEDAQFLREGVDGMKGRPKTFSSFGHSLAAADFGMDSHDDLIISSYRNRKDSFSREGKVHAVYGSKEGLRPETSEIWHQSTPGIRGKAEEAERFGRWLSAGDFDLDGYADLAAGVAEREPLEPPAHFDFVGAVNIIYGSKSGLTADGDQLWKRESLWPGEGPGAGFGLTLTAGDIGAGPEADLVLTEERSRGAGLVHVIHGSDSGLSAEGAQQWSQDSPDFPDETEDFDEFGASLTAGDFDSLHGDDVAIGVPGEDFPELIDAGAFHVLYSGPGGLSALNNQFWWQDSPAIPSRAEDDDRVGG